MLFSLQRCTDWAFDAEILYLARLLGKPGSSIPSSVESPEELARALSPRHLADAGGSHSNQAAWSKLVREQLEHADIVEPVADT